MQALAQLLKACKVTAVDVGSDVVCRAAVVGVAGQVAVLNLRHPAVA